MPYREKLRASDTANPRQLLDIWRKQRTYRIGKVLCYSGVVLSFIATLADLRWSPLSVIVTDLILLAGCVTSLLWIRAASRPAYFWWPLYYGLWISALPAVWNSGGISSPFLGVSLATLYVIAAVMDCRSRSFMYMVFVLLHLPAFYLIEIFHPLRLAPFPPPELTVIVTGATLCALFICVHSMLRTEGALSMEFSEHYRSLARAENELKYSEAQLREAQSIARIGSWEWDIVADRVRWSDELFKIFEVDKEKFDPSFRAYVERQSAAVRQSIEKIIQNSIRTGEDFQFEYQISTTQGTRYIFSHGRAVKDASGAVIKLLGTCQDITYRKQVESQLEGARRELEQRVEERTLQLAQSLEREKAAKEAAEHATLAKMQFLANMSHEIRTPMNSILGFADLLEIEISDQRASPEGRAYLTRIRANGAQLLHLIDDILDLSKFEAGLVPVHKSPFSLKALVDEVLASLAPQMKSKGLDLQLSYEGQIPDRLCSDPHRLHQVLTNMLNNAVKFSEKGVIRLRVRLESQAGPERRLYVDVEDSGIGISAENQQKLFQAFSQGDSSIGRKFGGSGLGLALSRRIAEALGGRLQLSHSAEGEGSHFVFDVPVEDVTELAEAPRSGAGGDSAHPPAAGEFRARRILLAEDSPDNEYLICRYLQPLGAGIDVARDGEEAVSMALARRYDCILMDIQMPGLDGLEATRRLRRQGLTQPIIALTAHALPAEMARSLEAGCNLHLTKPINRSELIQVVSTQLRRI